MQGTATATARFSWQRQLAFSTTTQHCCRISSRARQLVKYLICSAQLCAAAEAEATARAQATTVTRRMVVESLVDAAMAKIFLSSSSCVCVASSYVWEGSWIWGSGESRATSDRRCWVDGSAERTACEDVDGVYYCRLRIQSPENVPLGNLDGIQTYTSAQEHTTLRSHTHNFKHKWQEHQRSTDKTKKDQLDTKSKTRQTMNHNLLNYYISLYCVAGNIFLLATPHESLPSSYKASCQIWQQGLYHLSLPIYVHN